MTVDVLIKTYRDDFDWLRYCLRSIHKFVTGVREIVVLVPKGDVDLFRCLGLTRERMVVSAEHGDGYLWQQREKCYADIYTDADMVLFMDSDLICTRPLSPEKLMICGKPRWLVTPYSKLVNANGHPVTPWQEITERALGHPVEFETMRCHPFLVPRELFQRVRDFMRELHGMDLSDYIMGQGGRKFSEFNLLGAFAYYHAPHLFHWMNTEHFLPAPFVNQYWSYGGVTPDIRAQIESALQ